MKKFFAGMSALLAKRAIGGTLAFLVTGAVAGCVTYTVAPIISSGGDSGNTVISTQERTPVDKFVSSINSMSGINGKLDLSLSFPNEKDANKADSLITVENADLLFASNDDGVGFDFNGALVYNDWDKNADDSDKFVTHINYSDKDAYFQFWGGKFCYKDAEYDDLLSEFIGIFGPDAVKIPNELYDLLGGLLGSDSEESAESGSSLMGDFSMSWKEVSSSDSGYTFSLGLTLGDTLDTTLYFNSDANYNLTRVMTADKYNSENDPLEVSGLKVSLDLKAEVEENILTTISNKIADKENYTSLYSMKSLLRKVGVAVNKERFIASLDMSMTHTSDAGVKNSASLDLDGSFDFKNEKFGADISLLNNGDKTVSQDLKLAYLPSVDKEDHTGYLDYAGVLKAKMNLVTMEALLNRITDSTSGSESIQMDKIIDEAFDGDLLKSIREGHYEAIAKHISLLNISSEHISFSLYLNDLNLGDDAKIDFVMDANESGNPIAEIDISGVSFQGFALDSFSLKVDSYSASHEVKVVDADYNSLDRLPDVYDQVSSIVDVKEAKVNISASVLDGDKNGIVVSGDTAFNADKKVGTMKMIAKENKVDAKQHQVILDLDENAAKFNYDDASKHTAEHIGLAGKLSISSVTDIIDLVTNFTGDDTFNNRFGSLFDSLGDLTTETIIDQVMDGKYAVLISQHYLKSCVWTDDSVSFTINGEILGINDLTLKLTFEDKSVAAEDETAKSVRNLKSVSLVDFEMNGNTINASLVLSSSGDVEIPAATFANLSSIADEQFYDFSSVSLLTEYLLNTATYLTDYHLQARFKVVLWTADVIDINADLYIKLDEDNKMSMYAKLSDIPVIQAVNSPYFIPSKGNRTVEFYYDGNDIHTHSYVPFGTYSYIDEEGVSDTVNYDIDAKTKHENVPEYFSDTKNLMGFLLQDVVGLTDGLYEKLDFSTGSSDISFDASSLAFEDMLSDFSYSKTDKKWDLSLDLGALLGNDFLKSFDLSLGHKADKSGVYDMLSDLSFSLSVFAGVKVELIGSVNLLGIGESNFPTDSFNSYIEAANA